MCVCVCVYVCVLGSFLDQNVPFGFVLFFSHTQESVFFVFVFFFFLHQCTLMCIKILIYLIFLGNTAEGIHIYTFCTPIDNILWLM